MSKIELSIKDKLRTQTVRRWHIVATCREQTVADHSFGVILVGQEIIRRARAAGQPISEKEAGEFLQAAIDHDLLEVLTGDIPSPVKFLASGIKEIEKENIGVSGIAATILKAADILESIRWLDTYGVGEQKARVLHNLTGALIDRCRPANMSGELNRAIMSIRQEIMAPGHTKWPENFAEEVKESTTWPTN